MAPFDLYAELLPNIRQITFYASLRTTPSIDASSPPHLFLRDSRTAISVSYQDQTQSLRLPACVAENACRVLSSPSSLAKSTATGADLKEYSIRLQVDDAGTPEYQNDNVPWTARDMSSDTRVRCRECKNELFAPNPDSTVVWKDLPSHDWAEMMDLWHCHKPDTHPDDKDPSNGEDADNEEVKGYGAVNRLACEPGTVFVDVAAFVFAEGDCQGLKKGPINPPSPTDKVNAIPSQSQPPKELFCESCGALVGEEQPSLRGLKLHKTNISVSKNKSQNGANEETTWETFPADKIIAAQLLVLIDRTGARRFIIHAGEGHSSCGMLIWVFNPSLRYSSSAVSPVSAQQAMKVFYQPLTPSKLHSLLNPAVGAPASVTLEDLALPVGTYEDLKRSLEKSTSILPLSANKFREWKVGLLDVFEGNPTA